MEIEIKVPIVIYKDRPFYVYQSTSEEVLAAPLLEAVEVDLKDGRSTFVQGDYELIHKDGTCTMMHQAEFESQFKCVETPESLAINQTKEGGN